MGISHVRWAFFVCRVQISLRNRIYLFYTVYADANEVTARLLADNAY